MKKRTKLILFGILTFVTFFLLSLFLTGFFSALQPPYKESEYYDAPDEILLEEKINIENGSFDKNEVLIPKGKFVGFKIQNKDKVQYRLLFLKKQEGKTITLYEYFIKPNEEKLVYGLYSDLSMYDMPEKVKREREHTVMTQRFEFLYKIDQCLPSDECVLTCANCRGAKVQVKAIVEK
ncbi:MAG: hypothetical protein N3F05_05005 [Candidatus Diapherotrites archaeon]|nr:hypothetical protein [Candidatus Diapherotrites archaeon]